jgi:hypothetical protein
LPVDEQNNEKVMRIPESLKMDFTNFISGKKYNGSKTSGHDPTCDTGTCGEVEAKEDPYTLCCGRSTNDGKPVKVYHMGYNVDSSKRDYGPCRKFVESEGFIKGDDIV